MNIRGGQWTVPKRSMKARAIELIFAALATGICAGGDWRHYHGSDGTSSSDETNLPATFSDQENNIAWKAPLPGRGPSSPIVVAGRVIVTCGSGADQGRLHVLCLDAASGKLRWQRQLVATGHSACNPFGGVAIPTPASDGRRVFAFYGSNDLACFDLDGNLQWYRGLGYEHPHVRNDSGMGSSPLVIGDTVVVQMENQGESWAAGLDAGTGETRWTEHREAAATWTSPLCLPGKTPADDVVLLQSRSRLTAHEPRGGRQLWSYEGDCHTMVTGAVRDGRVYLAADGLCALGGDPAGGGVKLLWHEKRLHPGACSPVVHAGKIYLIKSPGILVCADAGTGKTLWQLRLEGQFWATPVLADGRLYAVNYAGLVQVVQLGTKGKLVGKAQIDKEILACPAVADGAIYFRSNAHLWKVALGAKGPHGG
jgi:outer membrane protein assembly factor BamB